MHLEASLPSVCDFAVLGNLKVDFLSFLRECYRRGYSCFDVTNSFGREFVSYIEPIGNLALTYPEELKLKSEWFVGCLCYLWHAKITKT